MGWVYLAEQQRPKRQAAVKIIAPESGLPAALLMSLRQEGDIAAQFQHPNLVTVYECGIIDGHYYLAMEHLSGGELDEKMKSGLNEKETVEIVSSVAAALGHIHHRGYVHRDIKPTNVMFTDEGRTVLADFGIAKSIDSVGPMTKLGYSTGTPAYMSPEQVHGDPIDQRSDLYSLGIMFYQMLVGRLPFAHDNEFDLREAHIREAPTPLPQSMRKFQPVVDRLLAKDPVDRFQHAEEMIEKLQGIDLDETQVTTRAQSNTSAVPQPSEREIELKLPASGEKRGVRVSEYFRRRRRRRVAWAWLFIALFVVYWFGIEQPIRPAEPEFAPVETASIEPLQAVAVPAEQSIAVLPFANMSDDPANDYFSDGITEELLNTLVGVPDLQVVGRTSSFAYKNRSIDLRQIGQELNATHILQGSVRRSGDTVRITAQLILAETGYSLWSDTFDRKLNDIFEVQEEISLAIVSQLGPKLVATQIRGLSKLATRNAQAYDIYLRGKAELRNALLPEDFDRAITYFDQALRKDPTFAEAEALKCLAYHGKYVETRDTSLVEIAVETCDRAVTMDESKPEVHVALGRLYFLTNRPQFAIAAFENALILSPRNDEAILGLADVHAQQGEIEKAIPFYRRAIELKPDFSRHLGSYAVALYQAGRFEDAVSQFREAIKLEPGNHRFYTNMGGAYYMLGQFQMAGAAFRRSNQYQPNGRAMSNAGVNFYAAGDFDSALEMFEKAVIEMPDDYRFRGNLGDACRWVNHCRDQAISHYRQALEMVTAHLRIDPRDTIALSLKALYLTHLGRNAEAGVPLAQALDLSPNNVDVLWASAVINAVNGNDSAALAQMQAAEAAGYPVAALRADPDLRAIVTINAARD
jgi:TolB-like protein/Flp pilus assembly protein TadD